MTIAPTSTSPADLAGSPPQVIVAGHICLDLIPALDGPVKIEPNRMIKIGTPAVSTGGAVANTGLALHRLGVPVRLVGKIGEDLFGQAVLNVLRGHAPHLADGIIVAANEATSYTIVISPPGIDRSFLHCPGANDTFSAQDIRYDLLQGAKIFHFGYPTLMQTLYADGGVQLQRMFQRVSEMGLATSLDLSQPDPNTPAGRVDWEQILARTMPFVDIFMPSIDELLFVLDRPLYARRAAGAATAKLVDRAALSSLADRLISMGTPVVGIKLGDQGLYLKTAAGGTRLEEFCARLGLDIGEWRSCEALSPCFRPERVAGTTGSGDCTIAGFLAALLRGESPATAATSATAVGACNVEAPDATSGVRPWPQVAQRLRAGWPRLPLEIPLESAPLSHPTALGTLLFASSGKESS